MNKKELNLDQMEQVNGGDWYDTLNDWGRYVYEKYEYLKNAF